jgi:hypothetical protein
MSSSPAGKSALNRREIPTSSYDFLNGAYKSAARARLVALSLGGVVAALVLLLAAQGLQASSAASTSTADLDSLTLEHQKSLAEFGTITGIAGVSERQLIDRDKVLSSSLAQGMGRTPDLVLLLSQVQQSAASSGVVIKSFSVSPESADDAAAADPNPSASASGAADPAANATRYMLSITGVAGGDYNKVLAWAGTLRSSGILQDPKAEVNGEEAVITGSFTSTSPSTATKALLQSLQVNLNTVVAPPPPGDPNASTAPGDPNAQPAPVDPNAQPTTPAGG